jgi:hypothetical protein
LLIDQTVIAVERTTRDADDISAARFAFWRSLKQQVGNRALPSLIAVLQHDAPFDPEIAKAVLETLMGLMEVGEKVSLGSAAVRKESCRVRGGVHPGGWPGVATRVQAGNRVSRMQARHCRPQEGTAADVHHGQGISVKHDGKSTSWRRLRKTLRVVWRTSA